MYDFEAARQAKDQQTQQIQPPIGVYEAKELRDLNMEQELVSQFNTVRQLQDSVLTDLDVPANQKAQVANAVASTIKMLVETQALHFNQERIKAIEAAMIKTLSTLPSEVATQFLDEYEKSLKAAGLS